jgi:hypothetical protein
MHVPDPSYIAFVKAVITPVTAAMGVIGSFQKKTLFMLPKPNQKIRTFEDTYF